jgi:hypothetical protein
MKDSLPLWVSMIEAIAMIARLIGKPPPEAAAKFVEAMQLGHVASWGSFDKDGISQEIPNVDWMICRAAFRRGWLLEPGRRIPRYTDIEIYAPDLTEEFCQGGEGQPRGRRHGPAPQLTERVKAKMRTFPKDELRAMKGIAMEEEFKASRNTCAAARKVVLSEFDAVQTLTNSEP